MKTKVGIEVECENVVDHIVVPQWKAVGEAMLHGGVEYVLRKPLAGEDLEKAITNLFSKFTTEKFSQRCSTHVHIDVSDMSRVQLFNFITLYTMFEHVMLTKIDKDRVGNLFCLPVFDSIEVQEMLYLCATKQEELRHINFDDFKYCSMNLGSIGKLGSLEFRALHGTKDVEELMNWVNFHVKLKEYAMVDNMDPEKLITQSSAMGYKPLFDKVMGELAQLFKVRDINYLIRRGMRNAQYFAFTGDWS